MWDSNIELNDNLRTIYIKEFTSLDIDALHEFTRGSALKIVVVISSLDVLDQFNKSELINIDNVHISLECTRQVFLLLNTIEILNNSIVKSIDLKNKMIILDFYLTKNISSSILENNIKILERMHYITDDVKIHSKNYEILYQANYILKEYKKTEDKYKNVKNKINALNNLINEQ